MTASFVPHSFVLADLFDVASMSYPVPDHVLEDDFGLVDCPTCGSDGWLLGYSPSVWTGGDTFTPCTRCHMSGKVLGVEDRFEHDWLELRRAA